MNRLATSVLAALAIAGMLFRPSGPSSEDTSPLPAAQTLAKQLSNPGTNGSGLGNPCQEDEGPWKALEDSLKKSEQDVPPSGSRNAKKPTPPLTPKADSHDQFSEDWTHYKSHLDGGLTQALIVTVPDPVHTDLALYFDRAVDSIVAAASAASYNLDGFWLPWDEKPQQQDPNCYWRLQEKREVDRREAEPGFLVFRGPPSQASAMEDLWWVFLVGESPVSGINKVQFSNAVKHIDAAALNTPINVAGPTFSGSADSLRLILSQYTSSEGLRFRISTFSVTDLNAQGSLRSFCSPPPRAPNEWRPCIRFNRAVPSDEEVTQDLVDYMNWQGLKESVLAFISESETAYGGNVAHRGKVADRVLRYTFPRGIAQLREAYGQSMAGGEKTNPLPRQLLPLVLNESPLNPETPPDFAPGQTPLSEELQMLALASELRHDRVQMAEITASDPMDLVFIIQFLRRTNPELQLVVTDWDLLLLRAQDEVPPDGLLVVTPYPLLGGGHEWSEMSESSHLFMPSRFAVALYNVCLLFLGQRSMTLGTQAPATLGQQSSTEQKPAAVSSASSDGTPEIGLVPPVWLTIVGRDGYWPIAILRPRRSGDQPVPERGEPLPATWVLVLSAVWVASLAVVSAFVRTQFVKRPRNHRWLENFSPIDAGEMSPAAQIKAILSGNAKVDVHGVCLLRRGFWLLVLLLALALCQVIVAAPLLHTFASLELGTRVLTAISWLLFGATQVCILAFYVVLRWVANKVLSGREITYYGVSLIAVVGAEMVFSVWWLVTMRRPNYYGLFFGYRSAHFTSGVSPALPLLLLALVLVVAAWTELDRLAKDVGRPRLSAIGIARDFRTIGYVLERYLHKTIFNLPVQLAGFLLFVLVLAVSYFNEGGILSMESRGFAVVYATGLVAILLLVLNQGLRFYLLWCELRRVLGRLEELPLREAFSRLPKQFSTNAIWQQGGAIVNYKRLTRMIECVKALQAGGGGPAAGLPVADLDCALSKVLATEARHRRPGHDTMKTIGRIVQSLATTITLNTLKPIWRQGSSDSTDGEEDANLTPKGRQLRLHYDRERILAEEFLALHYVAYIWNTCIQMRFLLFAIFTGFILAYLSVESYPFTAHHTLVSLLIFILVVLLAVMICVFVQMDKDAILSRIADREPGKLDKDFYFRVLSYVALPLFTVIAGQFPSLARWLFSWTEPALRMSR
jgi:hypothetical protein